MKKPKFSIKSAFRLLALMLCLAASVPQLWAQTYTVAGSDTQALGTSWSPSTTSNDMTFYSGYKYYLLKTVTYTSSGNYEYKVAVNHSWNTSYGNNGGNDNASYSVSAGTGFVCYAFDSNSHVPHVVSSLQTVVIAGDDTQALGSTTWSGSNTANSMTTTDGITYSLTKSVDYTSTGNKECKAVVANTDWYGNSSGGNVTYNIPSAGSYDVTYTFNAVTGIVTVDVQSATPTIPDYYITGAPELGLSWAYNPTTLMTYDATNDIYTYSYNVTATGTYGFVFADGQGSDWNNFNNNHRIGPTDTDQTYVLNSGYTTTQKSNGDHGAYMVTVGAGTVTITLDATNMQFKVEGTAPVINYDYYVIGDIFPNGWNTGTETLMDDNGDGTYSWLSGQIHLDMGTTYEYKVYSSDGAYHPSGANATFSTNVPGTYTITVTYDSSTGNVNAVLNQVSADPSYNYTFYVLPNDGSTTPTLYLWGTNNNNYRPNGDWPGTAMGSTEQLADGNNWYKYTGSLYANLMNAIVNNGGNGHQTSDITDLAPDTYYIRWNVEGNSYDITTDAPTLIVNYYVKGDDTSIFPNGWNTGASTLMADDGNGTYTWTTAANVHLDAGTYEYKVYGDNETWYPSGVDNATFTIDVPGTYSVTITFDGTTPTATATLISADPSYNYTFYALLDDSSVTPYLYLWDNANVEYAPAGLWPGSAMSTTEVLDDGNTWHKYTITVYANPISAIVNDNGQDENRHQTGDFTDLAPDTYYIRWNINEDSYSITTETPQPAPTYDYTIYVRYKGNATPYMYMWDGAGTHHLGDFPGTALTDATFTTEVINGYTYYKYTVTGSNYSTLGMILNEGSSSNQTGDLTVNPGTSYFTYGGGSTISEAKSEADPAITYYAENSFFGWTTEGTQMSADGNGGYSKTFSRVNLTANTTYEYKVYGADGTNEGVWFGDTNGNNATFTPSVTGIYDVTITLNSDGTISHTLTFIEATSQGTYYITGSEGLGLGWSFAPETEMTFDSSTGYYTYTATISEGGMYNFVFGNGQGSDWADFNGNHRIGPASSNNQAITPDGNWNSTQMANGNDGSYSITVNPGTVTFTFDPTSMRFKVEGDALTHNYTFYVLPSDHSTTPWIYLWGLGTDETYSNTYPGTMLTETEVLADGNTWYKLSVDLTVEYIHALVNGGINSANADNTKTQDITHIDPGTYYIYWTTAREPGQDYNDYFLTTVPPSAPGGTLYMIGTYYYNKEQYHYDSNSGALMKYDANTNLYYLNNVNLAVHNTFCFTTQLSSDWSGVGTRYGNSGSNEHVVGDGVTNYFPIDENWVNKAIALDEWSEINGEYRMLVPGIYNVLVNLDEKWVKLIKTDYYELTPMNVFLEQTPNVTMSEDGNNFIQNPGTEYSTQIYGDDCWPLCAYNGTFGDGIWDPHENGNNYPVTYVGDTTTVDGKTWWHWQVEASITELFFTRLNKEPLQSDTIRRKAGVLWVTWDEVDGQSTLTDHSREYFEAAANALPTNAVVMEGHYYVYFINTVDWDEVYCYAWDNNEQPGGGTDHTFYDGYSRLMSDWPGQPCELVGIDPVTGYEVWRYDFGTIIGTDIPNGGILFNDGNEYAETEAKEQTGDFEFINGAVYDYLGMVDGAFTLNNLIRNGAKDVRYTLSNDLLGVYYDKDAVTRIEYKNALEETVHEDIIGALYAKDLNLYAEKSVKPDSTYTDYVYDICYSDHTAGRSQIMIKKTTYDQSNWVKLVVSPNYDGRHAVVAPEERPDLSQYVNRIIPAGKLDVFMTDSINPTAHVLSIEMGQEMKYEPNVYISTHFNDTIVFNYTHQDWIDAELPYNYSCQPRIEWEYDTVENVVTVTGGKAYRSPDYSHPYKMFYVAPKPQEIAYITWVVYDNLNEDETWLGYTHGEYSPYTQESGSENYPQDPGRFYAPMNWNRTTYIDAEAYPSLSQLTDASELDKALGAWSPEYGPYSNGFLQHGAIKVNWSLFDVEASGGPWWQIIKPGQAYKFKALIRYARGSGYTDKEGDFDDTANNYYYGPSNGYSETDAFVNTVPGPGTVFNAPRRGNETGFANMYFTDYDDLDESKFIVFPIEASGAESKGDALGNVTTVKEVITDVKTTRTVSSVRYYNLMGVESEKPFDGINIVVVTFSDGSRVSRKVLR